MMEKHLLEIPLQQGETAHKTANSYARAIVQSMSYILESQSRETDVRLLGILNEMLDLYLRVQEKEYEQLEKKLVTEEHIQFNKN